MAGRLYCREPAAGTYRAQRLEQRVRRATNWYWVVASVKLLCLIAAAATYLTSGDWLAGVLTPVLSMALVGWLYLRFGGERFYAPDVILRRLLEQEAPAAKR
ncbi:MAG: hypothetical protein U0V87_10760 [Acidobacteriota bacterium]